MPSKRITHIADLPKWFCLEKYKATTSFSPTDWWEQLSNRRTANWFLSRTDAFYHKIAKKQFENIKDNPTQSKDILPTPDTWPRGNDINKGVNVNQGVNVFPLKCGYVHQLASLIDEHYGLNEHGNLGLGLASAHSVSKLLKESDSYMASMVPLVINLNGSDVDIKKEFNRYLETARAYMGIDNKKTHITPHDIERLQSYNILPYYDLMIWSKMEKCEITASVILDALYGVYSNNYQTEERFVAQTLKPFYKTIDYHFLIALDVYCSTKSS